MVTAISKGRYGNFNFVNMAAFVYSLKHGLSFHIQDKSLAIHQWPLYHQHLLHPQWNSSLPTVTINDNKHTYTELPFEDSWKEKNIIIGTKDIRTGYFQSFRYLDGYHKEIRKAFNLKEDKKIGIVGIHLRYGDYRQLLNQHPPITPAYIYNAMKFFMRLGYMRFYCFSDEIPYAKQQMQEAWLVLPGERPYEIRFIEGGTEQEDFIDFMNCEGNIVSNSSFSILAAILNPNPFKKVACPHEINFYGPGNSHLDPSTIMPPDWIRFKY